VSSGQIMRIAVLGPSRFGLGEPYCGGLESHTATLACGLHELGHHVVVFAGPRDAAHQLPVEVVPIIDRVACRRFAVATLSLSVMLQRYIGLYEQGRWTCPLPREMNNEGFRQHRVGPASRL